MLQLNIAAASDSGRVRPHNEDHVLLGRRRTTGEILTLTVVLDDSEFAETGLLLFVADGVGGSAAGEIASETALTVLEREFYLIRKTTPEQCEAALREAVWMANSAIRSRAQQDLQARGMGCTLSGLCLWRDSIWTGNVGDSRVYRYRNGFLKPLTDDNTVAAEMVRNGSMTLAEAAHSPQSHVLTSCMGNEVPRFQLQPAPALRDGDRLLVCSDGLYDMLNDDELVDLLGKLQESGASMAETVQTLIAAANAAGGRDNISVIMVAVHDGTR